MILTLQLLGAGLPRTATSSLGVALDQLLGGHRHHMSAIPGHPFDLGEGWRIALAGGTPNWQQIFEGYIAAVDWPASAFWQELSQIYPDALVILSVRDSAQVWYDSLAATILPVTRLALDPDWKSGRDLLDLFIRFTGTTQWDDPQTLMAAYERHNAEVRKSIPSHHLLEWNAKEGWAPLCRALNKPIPNQPFPWMNKKEDWG
jgi:hypothetical protein